MGFLNGILGAKRNAPEQPKPRDMVLRRTGEGQRVSYPGYSCATGRMEWVGKDGSVRVPQETTTEYSSIGGFNAAGKRYRSTRELCSQTDERQIWCKDRYGREVFCVCQRFPCFDSSDYLYETRFYRWWFIREGNVLTRIYSTDESGKISVTEDVADLENYCWEAMCDHGCCCEK